MKILPPIHIFEEIDVSKALVAAGRILYPKVARKSCLDDFLARRIQLKVIEERKIGQIKTEDVSNEDDAVDVESEDVDIEGEGGLEKQLNNMMCGKVNTPTNATQSAVNREMLNTIAKKIQSLRLHYTSISKLGKDFQCYSKGCNSNSSALISNCYSSLCLQRNRVRRELLDLLKKANVHTNATGLSLSSQTKKPSILEQKLTEPQKINKKLPSAATFCKAFAFAVRSAPKCSEEMDSVYVPVKGTNMLPNKIKDEDLDSKNLANNIKDEIKMEIDSNISTPNNLQKDSQKNIKTENESDVDVDMEVMTPDDIKEMILGSSYAKKEKSESFSPTITQAMVNTQSVDGVKNLSASKTTMDPLAISSSVNGTGKTVQTLNAKTTTYSAQQNRRFCAYRTIKREDKVIKTEHAEDGTERVYSAMSSEGKVYLKKIAAADKKKKRQVVKYPVCSTYQTRKSIKSILVLPKHDVRKLARHAGRIQIHGFHAMAKPNNSVWPYPCARPLFKTCWVYRTVNLKSLAAVALQLRIVWACLRWDDMQVKPPTTDGKHQITTETEILSLELLKHRHAGQFLERTQYLRRKVVIPLELPKTVRGE